MNCLSEAMRFGAIEDALDLLSALVTSWDACGFHTDREQLASKVLAAADARGMRTRAYMIVKSWIPMLAVQHQLRTDIDRQLAQIAEAEALARAAGDDDALIHTLACWVLIAPYAEFPPRSFAAIAEGLELATALGADQFVSSFELWAAMLAHLTGDIDRALALGVASISRATEQRDHRNLIVGTLALRPLLHELPELEHILPTPVAALELAREEGELVLATLLVNHGVEHALTRGDEATAARYLLEALAHGRSAPPVFACIALTATVRLFATWDEHERVAWLAGALQPSMAMIGPTLPPIRLQLHHRLLDEAAEAIGADRFEAAMARGRVVPLVAASRACESFIREHLDRTLMADIEREPEPTNAHLTPRQREVLRLLTGGMTNREIADRLRPHPQDGDAPPGCGVSRHRGPGSHRGHRVGLPRRSGRMTS